MHRTDESYVAEPVDYSDETWTALIVLVVLILVFIGFLMWRRLRGGRSNEAPLDVAMQALWSRLRQVNFHLGNNHEYGLDALALLSPNDLYYGGSLDDCQPLTLVGPLSSGAHASVFLGQLQVPKVSEPFTSNDYSGLAHESWAMQQIGEHDHIVRLIAVRSDPTDCLVFEFLSCGDLQNMLRYCSKDGSGLETITYDRSELSTSNLFEIIRQILNAVAYIARKGWIHRDLAARNCLVGLGLTVKVGDFGMCRQANENGEFLSETSGMMAVRSASPEVITQRRYSFSSDVWALSVLIWEVFTMGVTPYGGNGPSQVAELVLRGHRLPKPTKCPDKVWSLVASCFSVDPERRPSCAVLRRDFDSSLALLLPLST